jgi:hypothetical protein
MHIVFELHVLPGFDADSFMSEEAMNEAQAQVMTRAEAERKGLDGLPEVEGDVRYVLTRASSKNWVERAIDADPNIRGYQVYDVG